MTHGIARWSLVTVVLLLVGPAALAQTGPTTTQPVPWRQAALFRMDCSQDVRRFCYGVQPGEGRLIQCLSSHRSQLSPACVSRVAAARPTLGAAPPSPNTQSPDLTSANPPIGYAVTASALRAGCGPDVHKLCAGVQKENGGVVKCLSFHRMELSPTCDAFFKEMLIRRAAQKGVPKTTPPTANGPVAMPAVDSAADTGASSAASGPADTGTSSAANGSTDTGAPSAANAADADLPSAANGPAGTPAAADGADDTGALSAVNGPGSTPAATSGPVVPLDPPAVDGPASTSAPPAANATAATGATPAAKSPTARGPLDFPM
jgi:Cysteine rich repeat